MDAIDRFTMKYVCDLDTGCWVWIGARTPYGYGMFRLTPKLNTTAHRASWTLHHGNIPEGLVICHKCDNPSCANPSHLMLGTQKHNMADMIAKGRKGNRGKHGKHARGSRQGSAVMTEAQAAEAFQAKGMLKEIGDRYGVTKHTIFRLKKRKIWRHVTEGLTPG